MKRLLLALLSTISLHAAEPWTKTEVALEAAFQLVLLADYNQTSQFHKFTLPTTDGYGHTITYSPGVDTRLIKEANPLLPKFPNQRTINRVFIGSAIGHALITHHLSHIGRAYWQASTLSVELWVVNSNYNLGVSLKF